MIIRPFIKNYLIHHVIIVEVDDQYNSCFLLATPSNRNISVNHTTRQLSVILFLFSFQPYFERSDFLGNLRLRSLDILGLTIPHKFEYGAENGPWVSYDVFYKYQHKKMQSPGRQRHRIHKYCSVITMLALLSTSCWFTLKIILNSLGQIEWKHNCPHNYDTNYLKNGRAVGEYS